MATQRSCICGQRFSSEGEQALHQRNCEAFKRDTARTQLVLPLETELDRLAKEAEAIASDFASAFDRLIDGNTSESAYHVQVAQEHLDGATMRLRELADKTIAVAKNRYVTVDRLRREITELVERLQRYEATIKKAKTYFRPRHA